VYTKDFIKRQIRRLRDQHVLFCSKVDWGADCEPFDLIAKDSPNLFVPSMPVRMDFLVLRVDYVLRDVKDQPHDFSIERSEAFGMIHFGSLVLLSHVQATEILLQRMAIRSDSTRKRRKWNSCHKTFILKKRWKGTNWIKDDS
jgi:hypothetical protein